MSKNEKQTEPLRVADYLYNLPLSGLTPREKSELWNACGAFVGKCAGRGPLKQPEYSGTQTGRISGAKSNVEEVRRGSKAKG